MSAIDVGKLAYSLREIRDHFEVGGKKLLTKDHLRPLAGNISKVSQRLGLGKVYEWKPDIRQRVIFAKSDELVFIDYSHKHMAVEELDDQGDSQLRQILENTHEAPNWLTDRMDETEESESRYENEFKTIHGGHRENYEEALGNEWITFLDQAQQIQLELLETAILENPNKFSLHMLLGGAGTGKTMVLLQLAWRLRNIHGIELELILPEGVKEQLKFTLGIKGFERGAKGLILLDDPTAFENIQTELARAQAQKRPMIYAIDPTQWHDKKVREKFSSFLSKTELTRYPLTAAYRQGGAIGAEVRTIARHFLRNSSFRADTWKIDKELESSKLWESLCLDDVTFVDSKGHYKEYPCEKSIDYQDALSEIFEITNSYDTYRSGWPKALLVTNGLAPKIIASSVIEARNQYGFEIRERTLYSSTSVRGAEYETVVLAIPRLDWVTLKTGKMSMVTNEWEKMLRILTFMTRAENQLAILIVK
jgi:hypothetical protein